MLRRRAETRTLPEAAEKRELWGRHSCNILFHTRWELCLNLGATLSEANFPKNSELSIFIGEGKPISRRVSEIICK